MNTELPFGPYLATAAVFYLFAEPWIDAALPAIVAAVGRPSGRADHRRRRAQRAPRRHHVRRDPPRPVQRPAQPARARRRRRRSWPRPRSASRSPMRTSIASVDRARPPQHRADRAPSSRAARTSSSSRAASAATSRVQDLITARARAEDERRQAVDRRSPALIGKAVVEALAAAHAAGVVHGAVHPRSVLIDEDGAVRLGDFVVGRALTTAVAQGADSSLWRGLAGYIAPELVVGEDPTPAADVFAVGAMLFTMLTGEAPPGTLRATPAVERLVQRALDTDATRRYADGDRSAREPARGDRGRSLGARRARRADQGSRAVAGRRQHRRRDRGSARLARRRLGGVRSRRPGRAWTSAPSAIASRSGSHRRRARAGRLDALLADLDEPSTDVESTSARSRRAIRSRRYRAWIRASARRSCRARACRRSTIPTTRRRCRRRRRSATRASRRRANRADRAAVAAARDRAHRRIAHDEAAALAAIGELDEPVRRVSTAAEQAEAAAAKLEEAAVRAERAAKASRPAAIRPSRRAAPVAEPPIGAAIAPRRSSTTCRRRSSRAAARRARRRARCSRSAARGYGIYRQFTSTTTRRGRAEQEAAATRREEADDDARRDAGRIDAQPDPGALEVTSNRQQRRRVAAARPHAARRRSS